MQGYSTKLFLEQIDKKVTFPLGVYFVMVASLGIFIFGANSIWSANKIQAMINNESMVRSDFNSLVQKDMEILSGSVRMGYYTGQNSWEARYFDTIEELNSLEMKNYYYGYPPKPEDLEVMAQFKQAIKVLNEYDKKIFENVRFGKNNEALALLKSPDREKNLAQLEKAFLI